MTRRSRDRAVLGLCAFFVVVALTVELWWLRHGAELPALHGWLAGAFRLYAAGDRGYYDQISRFEVALETMHVFVTQGLYLLLAWAVLVRAPFRFPLQLCLGAYVAYSVVLYFAAKHMTAYAQMPVHDARSFALLVAPNLPWLLGSLFMAADAGAEIARAVAAREQAAR